MNSIAGRIIHGAAGRSHKFNAQAITIDGHRFPSLKQGARYRQLKFLLNQNLIRNLRLEVAYKLNVNGLKICNYRADFVYEEYVHGAWPEVVEDVKGIRTPVYNLKKKLMFACHGITIRES